MKVQIFRAFGLEMPIHTPKITVLGIWLLKWRHINRTPKRHILAWKHAWRIDRKNRSISVRRVRVCKNTTLKPMGTTNLPNYPFPLGHVNPGLIPTTLTTANDSLIQFTHFRTTTQQSPHWLQWDALNSPQKLPLPITRPTALTTTNGIRIHSAVLPQYTFHADRQTDRPTNRHTLSWACDNLIFFESSCPCIVKFFCL